MTTWRTVEDSGTGDKELLMARGHQRSKAICGEVQCLPMKQELDTTTSRKTYAKFDSREGVDSH